MVLGNLMQLGGFRPDDIYRWFMELFIDAYDWVMVPNVYGMALYADGGLITTKPYIAGSSYIRKMSELPTRRLVRHVGCAFLDLSLTSPSGTRAQSAARASHQPARQVSGTPVTSLSHRGATLSRVTELLGSLRLVLERCQLVGRQNTIGVEQDHEALIHLAHPPMKSVRMRVPKLGGGSMSVVGNVEHRVDRIDDHADILSLRRRR